MDSNRGTRPRNTRKVLAMWRFCLFLTGTFVLLGTPSWATTCVANREFKVRQVCGVVTYKGSETIPDVNVELLDSNSSVLQSAPTDANGQFVFASVKDGKYILRIKFDGFAIAWQPFRVARSKNGQACRIPMHVTLELAGSCSSVNLSK